MDAIVPSHRLWGNLESASDGLVMGRSQCASSVTSGQKWAQLQHNDGIEDRIVVPEGTAKDSKPQTNAEDRPVLGDRVAVISDAGSLRIVGVLRLVSKHA